MKNMLKSVLCLMVCAVMCIQLCIVSFAEDTKTENKGQTASESMPVQIKGKSAILMDCTTGTVLLKYNEHEKLPPASVTKIMPLLLVVEAIDSGKISLGDSVPTSATAASKGGSQIWLKEGETMTVDELLKAVAIASANDACASLGEFLAGSEEAFVQMMNDRAKELGMNDTVFVNCSGLDDTDSNITSAHDIALMSVELMKHDLITKYTTVWMDSLRGGATELVNTNKLVRFYKGTTGLKTGTTNKAGCCLSATAKRDGLHLAAVVMGSDNSNDRFETAKALLNWGFSNYTMIKPAVDKNLITDVLVTKGESSVIKPQIPEVTPILVKKGEEKNIKQEVTLALTVEAPVEKGQSLGEIKFTLNGETLARYDICSPDSVDVLRFGEAFRRLLAQLA